MYTNLTTFERQRTIIKWVQERLSVKVDHLAKIFDVSEGTIRNDLSTLESQQALTRIRGGAVATNGFEAHILQPSNAKVERLARWATDLVRNHDVIFLDASSTVCAMATHLRERQHLTIITNHLETARLLAKDPSKTIILTGGILSSDGTSVTGLLGHGVIKDLQIKTAFLSCTAVSLEAGLMEPNLDMAQFKEHVIASSKQVVALVDSTLFNTVSLRSFAKLEQLHHLITDDEIPTAIIEQLRIKHVPLTICGETTIQSLSPLQQKAKYKIAFANLSEEIPFAVDVRRSLEEAAQKHDVDLILADNQLNRDHALHIADNLAQRDIDLLIEYQIDVSANNRIVNRFQQRGIPIIAVDIPMVGATYFGVNNYLAGHIAGEALGKWIQTHWQGNLDYLLILEEKRAGALPAARIQGQLEGLLDIIPMPKQSFYLDSGNTTEISYQHVMAMLEKLESSRLGVLSFNDDAALGALRAIKEAGWNEAAIVGQGADRMIRSELRKAHSPVIGSTAFHPEKYGEMILELAFKLLRKEAVQPAVYVDTTFINRENVNIYYPDES